MEQVLSDNDNRALRQKGILQESEVGVRVGDKVVAENVLTKERRMLGDAASLLAESGRRVLND